jgi:sugar O-acyltransferase (sialic acid O-acetyltransferase NeuD family)
MSGRTVDHGKADAGRASGAPAPPRLPVVIFGTGVVGQVACEYFERDGREVKAFAVERAYLDRDELLGKPVVPFEDVQARYPPEGHDLFIAMNAVQMQRPKRRIYAAAKALGYSLPTYVSPNATVARSAVLGDNCFVTDHAVVQPFARVGAGCVLWIGCLVAHHAIVGDFCMLAGHSVVGGVSKVGDNSFVGINATIIDEIEVAPDCLVGAGAVVTRSTLPGEVWAAPRPKRMDYTSLEYFGMETGPP